MTFAEYPPADRRSPEEGRGAGCQSESPREGAKRPEFEVDFDVKATGEARAINGFDCKQTIVTITVRQKGKTLDEAGGIVHDRRHVAGAEDRRTERSPPPSTSAS